METIGQALRKLNALPRLAALRTRTASDWSGSELVRDAAAEVPALKRRSAGELQVRGSAKRLFASGTVPAAMRLVRSATTAAGATASVYRRAGALGTGSFELPEK